MIRSAANTNIPAASVFLGLIAFLSGNVFGQDFWWNRTAQQLVARSEAILNAQGDNETPTPDIDDNTTNYAFSTMTPDITRPVKGGGGGGGGDGGGGFNGADGSEGSGDGDDGLDLVTNGGLGGNAGADGSAYSAGEANNIVELNPNNQAVLQLSFIHGQNNTIELSGGGGGGAGGGGEFDVEFAPGDGGAGGFGENADANGNTIVQTRANVVAVLNSAAWVDVNNDVTDAFVVIDIGWSSTSSPTLGDRNGIPLWSRQASFRVDLFPVGNQQGNGNANVTIAGTGPGNPLLATGIDGFGNLIMIASTTAENSVVGSLSVGPEDCGVRTLAGCGVLFTDGAPSFRSVLGGDMLAAGGTGGLPGFNGQAGTDGLDGFFEPSTSSTGTAGGGGSGGSGGGGGAGGGGIGNGGNGGDGGNGASVDGYCAGFYQGSIAVWVSQLP